MNWVEQRLCWTCIILTLTWVLGAWVRSVELDVRLAGISLGLQASLLIFGIYLRKRLGFEKAASLFIALCFYVAVITGATNVTFLRFPVSGIWLDAHLQTIDDWLGYDWASYISWMSERPSVGSFLAAIYATSLLQLAALLAVLAFSGHVLAFNRFVIAAISSLALTILFWLFIPTFGPSLFIELPQAVESDIRVINDSRFRIAAWDLIHNGATTIPPQTTLGFVAFPSYHTVMMLLTIYYGWCTRARWLWIAINIPMLPAILGQGAHYVADVVAGGLVFWVCVRFAKNAVKWPPSSKSATQATH